MMTIITIAKYTALEVFYNRFGWLLLLGILLGVGAGMFGHALAITESQEIQIGFMAASLRLMAVFILALLVTGTIVRELNDKSLEMLLSLPITRTHYYIGKFTGFIFVIFFIVLGFSLCLLIAAPASQIVIWSLSLFCELTLVLGFSLLCALSFRQVPLTIFFIVCFYLLSRSINATILILQAPSLVISNDTSSIAGHIFQFIALFIPDLSLFTRSEWLMYNTADWSSINIVLIQTIGTLTIFVTAGLIDFYRKNI